MASDDVPSRTIQFQLEMLSAEVNQGNQSIVQIDQITQTTKYWCIVLWAGSIALALGKGQEDLRQYILLTAILPILFWFIEGRWRRIQRGFIFRVEKISEFLNGPSLSQSFYEGKLVGFTVLDPKGSQYRETPEYQDFCSLWRVLWHKRVAPFYLCLALLSLALGVYFGFR